MKRTLLLAILYIVCVTLHGVQGQDRPKTRKAHTLPVTRETLIEMKRAWREACGNEFRLEEFHRLLIEEMERTQTGREHLKRFCKSTTGLRRSVYYRNDALPIKGKIRKRSVKKTASPQMNGTVNTARQKELTKPVPAEFNLAQNFPNPFNPCTDIGYQIPDSRSHEHTSLRIYNILGQEVRTLVDEVQKPGYYAVTWDGKDNNGGLAASGVYFYRLTAGDFTATKRMMLMK